MSYSEFENWNPMEEDYRMNNSRFQEMHSFPDGFNRLSLYVKNIPRNMKQEELKSLMSEGGRKVKSVKVNNKISSNSNVTYGFVNFENPSDASNALCALNKCPPYFLDISFKRASNEDYTRNDSRQFQDYPRYDERQLQGYPRYDERFQVQPRYDQRQYQDHLYEERSYQNRQRYNERQFQDYQTDSNEIPEYPYSSYDQNFNNHVPTRGTGRGRGRGKCPNDAPKVNSHENVYGQTSNRGRGARIDLDGVKSLSSQNLKVSTVGRDRKVTIESTETCKSPLLEAPEINKTDSLDKHPIKEVKKKQEFQGPELCSNPFIYCFYCGKEARLSCGNCRRPYCSRNCQMTDWPSHQQICVVTKGVTDSILATCKSLQNSQNTDSSYMSESSNSDCDKSEDTIKQERKHIEVLSLVPGQNEKVLIVHSESPAKFWVQLQKFSGVFSSMEKKLSSVPKTNLSNLKIDFYCCCKYDNDYYRAKITKKISPNEVEVQLLDYGKSVTVLKQDIFYLPEECRDCPIQAICCKLVDETSKNERWSNDDALSFQLYTENKIYKAHVVKCHNDINEVSLINEDGVALYSVLAELKNSGDYLDGNASPPLNENAPPSIFSQLKEGNEMTVVPIIREDKFCWCYILPNENGYKEIGEIDKLLENYAAKDINLSIEEGDFAVGFSVEYQKFYRCIVLKRKQKSFLVQYIDYGNEEEINLIKELSPELFNKCSYIVKCEKPDSVTGDEFIQTFSSEIIKATVKNVKKNVAELNVSSSKPITFHCYPCYTTESTETIQTPSLYSTPEKTVKKCNSVSPHTPKPEIKSIETISPPKKEIARSPKTGLSSSEEKTMKNSYKDFADKVMCPRILLPGNKYSVKVVFLKNESEIFVQLYDDEATIKNMFTDLNNYCNSAKPGYIPIVSEIVCCKYSEDGFWYRGQVKSKIEDKFQIFFVDYGNEDMVSEKDIIRLPEKFALPKLSTCFSLIKVKISDVLATFKSKLFDEMWDMEVIDFNSFPPEVMLYQKDSSLVELIKDELGSKTSKAALKFQKLPTKSPVKVKICYLDEKYTYVHRTEDLKSIGELCIKLNEPGEKMVPKKVIVGNVYCGLFSDNLWYRVSIEKEIAPDAYRVYFLDYGNYENLNIKDLREVPEDLFSLPVYCIPVIIQSPKKEMKIDDEFDVEVVGENNAVQEIKLSVSESLVKLPKYSSMEKRLLKDGINEVCFIFGNEDILYCQLTSDTEAVLDIRKKIQKIAKESDSPRELSVGDVVCAKSCDGSWYRASVISSNSVSAYNVLFFDYGNPESVSIDDIKILPKEMIKPPVFAIPVKIKNSGDVTNPDIFTGQLSVKKVGSKNDVNIVEIVVEKNIKLPKFSSLKKELLPVGSLSKATVCHLEGEDTYYIQTASNEKDLDTVVNILKESEKFQSLSHLPEIDDIVCAKFIDDGLWYRSYVQEVVDKNLLKVCFMDYGNSSNVSLENIKVLPSEVCTYPPLCIPVKFKNSEKVKQLLLEGNLTFDIKVHKHSAGAIIADVCEDNAAEVAFSYKPVQISDFKKSTLPKEKPCKLIFKAFTDSFYFAIKSDDLDEIHDLTAVLQKSNTKTITHFVSIDEIVLVKGNDNTFYRGCIKKFLPNDTFKVFFVDVGIIEDVKKSQLYCLPENSLSFPLFAVEVSVKSGEPVVLEKTYMAQVTGQNADGKVIVDVYHQYLLSSLERKELPVNKECSVVFCHKEGELFFLQDVTDSNLISDFLSKLQDICLSNSFMPYKPDVGEILCAKSQGDQVWYRGCVEEILNEREFKILFIDYGNYEVLNMKDLKRLPADLAKVPTFCVPVKLVKSSDGIEFDKMYSVIAQSKLSNNVQVIQIMQPEEVKDTIQPVEIRNGATKFSAAKSVPFHAGEQDIVIYSIPDSEELNAFCAPFCKSNLEANLQLILDLTKFVESQGTSFKNGQEPDIDDMVMAQFPDDNQWYRAAIVDKDPPHYDVHFVDYGNVESLEISSLRKMEEKFMELPIQAHLCSFKGFTVTDQNKQRAIEEIKKFTVFNNSKPIKAKVEICDDDIIINVPSITAHLLDINLAV